ncbi:glycosyltransferase family 4 protein [Ruegeria sediminis]|nr:glycosyltransferase family 4 protein [Ruegeria sediminis]
MTTEQAQNGDQAPLSVLQIGTQFNLGGIPRHMLSLAQTLRELGHDVTLSGNAGTWYGPNDDPDFLELPIRYVASEGGGIPARLKNLAHSVFTLRRWLRLNRVDLIHAHESAPALVSMMARAGLRIPVAVTYHGSEPERVKTFSRVARHCDLVITPSHASARDLIEIGGIPETRVQVLGLGVKPAPLDSAEEIAAVRRRYLGDGEKLIVTVARQSHQKGIDILIDCVARMKDSHPGYRFLLVGDGHLEKEYKALATEKGVLNHLTFAGRTERVHLHIRAADVFALTSRYESLPFVIPEAFQTGTPVVATACSGVVELVDDSVGRVVPIGDVPAICTALHSVLADEAALERMGAAALERSREDRFNPDWVHRQFVETYRKLAAKF